MADDDFRFLQVISSDTKNILLFDLIMPFQIPGEFLQSCLVVALLLQSLVVLGESV